METQKKSVLQSNAGGPVALLLLAIGGYAMYAHYSNPNVNFEVRIDVSGSASHAAIGYGTNKTPTQVADEAVPFSKTFPISSKDIVAITAHNEGREGTLKLTVMVKVESESDWQNVAERECEGGGCKVNFSGVMPERKLF